MSNAGIMVWGDLVTAVLHRVALASAGREVRTPRPVRNPSSKTGPPSVKIMWADEGDDEK